MRLSHITMLPGALIAFWHVLTHPGVPVLIVVADQAQAERASNHLASFIRKVM